jgi:hypothetical protein
MPSPDFSRTSAIVGLLQFAFHIDLLDIGKRSQNPLPQPALPSLLGLDGGYDSGFLAFNFLSDTLL